MQVSTRGNRLARRFANLVTPAVVALAAACSGGGDDSPQAPVLPPTPPSNPQLRQAAFIFDVDVRNGRVKVTEPTTGLNNLSVIGGFGGGPSYSIVGGDVLEVITSGFAVTAGGGFPSGTIPVGPCPGGTPAAVPGRLCVEFDVSVINELTSVQLVGPAVFPTAPAGTTGPLLFPFDVVTTTTAGGTSTGGAQGNDVIIELPSTGEVTVNEEWAGAPHNFFNDTPCPTGGSGTQQGTSDCFRWEELTPTPLPGTATSNATRVGFYLDPTVGTYRVRLLVAADLQNQGAAASGSIAGTVTSPQLGALSGVQVAVSGVAGTQATSGTGAYTFATVGLGPRSVSITGGLPAGCTTPAAQNVTVQNGVTTPVNFTVTCPVPVGTINGIISSSLGGTLTGVSVTITPAGGSALAPVLTNAAGQYSNAAVPLGTPTGTGTISFAAIPAGCTNPGPQPYSGLTNGGTITVSVTFTCTPPPAVYVLRGTWGGTGAARTYTITYDLTGRDDPAIPGADDVFVVSGTTRFANATPAGITFSGSSNVAGSLLQNQGANNVTQPAPVTPAGALDIAWLNFDTDPGRATGNVGVINLNFAGTPTATVTPTTSFGPTDDVQSENGTNLLTNTQLSEAVLTP